LKHFETSPILNRAALKTYMRVMILNLLRDEVRRHGRMPAYEDDETFPDDFPKTGAAYDVALTRLTEPERQLIVTRVEMRMSYEEIATMLGLSSGDAARMAFRRAVRRLTALMRGAKQP
jgi:RNA polymerase sigma factor (sigma-70 family)